MFFAFPAGKKSKDMDVIDQEKTRNHFAIVKSEEVDKPILNVKNLSLSFTQYTGGLRQRNLQVISNLNVSVNSGEILAVVGSSGSGKSLLAHAILGIIPENGKLTGSINYEGEKLTTKKQAELRGKEIALVPQSVNFLDPLMKVGVQVQQSVKEGDCKKAQRNIFSKYHLASSVENLYPFQVSGGMARRVLVATAMVSGAKLVIADEPTPGLDEKAVKETLSHFRQLADEGRGVMLITHDIETALKIADRIAVFYAGTTIEVAPAKDFVGKGEALRHPYSKALWNALPQNEFKPIEGSQPLANNLPSGCLFEPRCSMATPECAKHQPEVKKVRGGMVRCFYAT